LDVCLAIAGRDGGSLAVCGTFDETADYRRLDVVARNGGSFVALKDGPGPCPGSGWQLLASQGKRGVAGEKGERGPKGDPGLSGATIREWKVDRARYVATPVMSDGREGPPLELRGLFEQFFARDELAGQRTPSRAPSSLGRVSLSTKLKENPAKQAHPRRGSDIRPHGGS
jgi:hypothetical protein